MIADSLTIGYLGTPSVMRIAHTDGRGEYHLEHVPADGIIVAQHGHLRSHVRSAKDGARLVLQPTTRISGRVDDPDPQQLTVFVVPADRDTSPMYQMLAPIAADGTFTIDRVPIGRLRIGAVHGVGNGAQSFAMQELSVGPKGKTDVVVRRALGRKLRVVVRSAAQVSLAGAQVFVVSGTVSIKTVKEIESVLRSPGMAIEVARPLTGETPPELGKLLPGDLVATFANAPAGVASACALGLSGDFGDPGFREKVQRHLDELEVRCVPIAADAKAITVEVPPMKRID